MRTKSFYAFVMFLIGGSGMLAMGQETATESDESAKIQAAIQSYAAAFNAKDVAKLTAHWSPDGVYTSRTSGKRTVGREAIAANFSKIFENDSVPKLATVTESIDFISPNVALERGTATVTHSAEEVIETEYSVVYVKRDGSWLIDRVTENDIVTEESHYDELKDLEWLVGDWSETGDGFRIEFSCQWTTKQNFLSRKFKVLGEQNEVESSGLQIIGWDAKEKTIRSWLFDSDGGVVNGTWNKTDDGWTVQSVASLADGGSGSFASIFRPQDDGSVRWKKINRVVDGKLLPNIDEIVIQRK